MPFTAPFQAARRLFFPRAGPSVAYDDVTGALLPLAATTEAWQASVVAAPIAWIARAMSEAEMQVEVREGHAWIAAPEHPAQRLLASPSQALRGDVLWRSLVVDLVSHGEAFAIIESNALGEPAGLIHVPPAQVTPVTRGLALGEPIREFQVRESSGTRKTYAAEDMVYARYLLSGQRGISPLAAASQEVLTDTTAAAYAREVFESRGVPYVLAVQDDARPPTAAQNRGGEDAMVDAHALAARIGGQAKRFIISLRRKVNITRLSMSPRDMNSRELRRVAEARVCALLGIPAEVVGFDAAAADSNYAKQRAQVRQAYENGLIPVQKMLLGALNAQLMPRFDVNARFAFSLSSVQALQEDATEHSERVIAQLRAGVIGLREARRELGYAPEDVPDIRFVPMQLEEVPVGELAPVQPDAPLDQDVAEVE